MVEIVCEMECGPTALLMPKLARPLEAATLPELVQPERFVVKSPLVISSLPRIRGASFTLMIVIAAVSVFVENAVVPPLAVVSADPPLLPSYHPTL